MNTPPQELLKILLIGDSCLDVYHYGICDRLSPEAPVPVLRELRTENRAGMSANVNENLKSFGMVVDHLTNPNIIEKHRFIDERYNQHLLRYDTGEKQPLHPIEPRVIELYKLETDYDAVVISDYNKGFLPPSACNIICDLFKDKPVFVDTKKTDLSCFSDCIIKINEKEHNNVARSPHNSEFVVTLGDRGAFYKDKIFETYPIEVFDVCGAGDVFLATLVYGFLKNQCMHKAIVAANQSARLSVSKMGTYVLLKEDIDELCV